MPFNGIEPFVQAEQDCIFIVQFLEDTYIVLMKTKYPHRNVFVDTQTQVIAVSNKLGEGKKV